MSWPEAEVVIDEALVRDLLRAQFPDLADQQCCRVNEGFDNSLWRVGDDHVARLPRREMAVVPLQNELLLLSDVLERVSLRTPLPLRPGQPSDRFAWPWMIATWVDGVPGDELELEHYGHTAGTLATFLRELHAPAPSDAPHNPFRGVPLEERNTTLEARLPDVRNHLDVESTFGLWHRTLRAPVWEGPLMWTHGDFHPGNLVYRDHELAGVVDFGDLGAGDPATDLAGGLLSLPYDALDSFFAAYGVRDDAMLWRTVGWAVFFGVMAVSLGRDRPTYLTVGRRGLANAAAVAAQL